MSRMNITYDYYRIFYYVAKYKNFTQAANVLMSNQPNVSRAINNLENELGCRLFLRSNRGVTLTPEGQRLYSRVAVAQRQLQAAEQELTDAKSLHSGMVSIGVSETALHSFLLPRLKRFHQLYPGIRIQLSSVTTPRAVTLLKSGAVDFSVVTSPAEVTLPLKKIVLMQFHDLLVAGPRFAHLAQQMLPLKELTHYPLILLNTETTSREFYNRFFLAHGLSLLPDIEAATTDQVLPMIKYDLGMGFLPEGLAREALDKKEIFQLKLDCEIPQRSICLIKDAGRSMSIAAKALEKILHEDARPHAESKLSLQTME